MYSQALLAALVAGAAAYPMLEVRQTDNQGLEDFISRQFNISLEGALLNIGGVNGNIVSGAEPGFVVASPSRINPDYFFTWTRDSALTELMITDELIFGTESVGNNSLQIVVEEYTGAQAALQTVTNPSGSLWPAGQGLGEPKFYSNGTEFIGAWGRYVTSNANGISPKLTMIDLRMMDLPYERLHSWKSPKQSSRAILKLLLSSPTSIGRLSTMTSFTLLSIGTQAATTCGKRSTVTAFLRPLLSIEL